MLDSRCQANRIGEAFQENPNVHEPFRDSIVTGILNRQTIKARSEPDV